MGELGELSFKLVEIDLLEDFTVPAQSQAAVADREPLALIL